MALTYLVIACTLLIGLFSVGKDFPLTPLYTIAALGGLCLSYLQYRTRRLPFLRILANIALLALTVKAIAPFFQQVRKEDMFTLLVQTWIYFMLIQTAIIYVKRDYYIVQALALGLLIYACFFAANNPLNLLGYIVSFLVFWIMGLRMIGFLPEHKGEKSVVAGAADVYREFKLGAVIFLAALLLSLPFYFIFPRASIPLLPPDLEKLLHQRYSAIYADFPKRGLMKFLSRNPRDLYTHPPKPEPGKMPMPGKENALDYQFKINPELTKPEFWHAIESLREKIEKLKKDIIGIGNEHTLVEVPRDVQEWDQLLDQQLDLKRKDTDLEQRFERAKNEYLTQAATPVNEQQQLEQQKQQQLENQMQATVETRKALTQQLTAVDQSKSGIRTSVYNQANQSTQQLRVLWDRKDELEQQLMEQLRKVSEAQQKEMEKARELQKETPPPPPVPQEQPKKEEKKQKPEKPVTILDIILYGLLFLLITYVIGLLLMFILPFIRHRGRFVEAVRNQKYNLAISLLYNYLAHILIIVGFRYPVVILPEQYLVLLDNKYPLAQEHSKVLTWLFIEARYSHHDLSVKELEHALTCYQFILQEAKANAPFIYKQLISLPFLSYL